MESEVMWDWNWCLLNYELWILKKIVIKCFLGIIKENCLDEMFGIVGGKWF